VREVLVYGMEIRFSFIYISSANNYYTLQAFSPFIDTILSYSTHNEKNKTFKNKGSKLLQMAFCDNMDKM